MEVETEGNITTVTLTFEEWEKQPFPQVHPYSLLLDHIMQYRIKGIPPHKRYLFHGLGGIEVLNN